MELPQFLRRKRRTPEVQSVTNATGRSSEIAGLPDERELFGAMHIAQKIDYIRSCIRLNREQLMENARVYERSRKELQDRLEQAQGINVVRIADKATSGVSQNHSSREIAIKQSAPDADHMMTNRLLATWDEYEQQLRGFEDEATDALTRQRDLQQKRRVEEGRSIQAKNEHLTAESAEMTRVFEEVQNADHKPVFRELAEKRKIKDQADNEQRIREARRLKAEIVNNIRLIDLDLSAIDKEIKALDKRLQNFMDNSIQALIDGANALRMGSLQYSLDLANATRAAIQGTQNYMTPPVIEPRHSSTVTVESVEAAAHFDPQSSVANIGRRAVTSILDDEPVHVPQVVQGSVTAFEGEIVEDDAATHIRFTR